MAKDREEIEGEGRRTDQRGTSDKSVGGGGGGGWRAQGGWMGGRGRGIQHETDGRDGGGGEGGGRGGTRRTSAEGN